jgi:hypothetical protein
VPGGCVAVLLRCELGLLQAGRRRRRRQQATRVSGMCYAVSMSAGCMRPAAQPYTPGPAAGASLTPCAPGQAAGASHTA